VRIVYLMMVVIILHYLFKIRSETSSVIKLRFFPEIYGLKAYRVVREISFKYKPKIQFRSDYKSK